MSRDDSNNFSARRTSSFDAVASSSAFSKNLLSNGNGSGFADGGGGVCKSKVAESVTPKFGGSDGGGDSKTPESTSPLTSPGFIFFLSSGDTGEPPGFCGDLCRFGPPSERRRFSMKCARFSSTFA